MTHPWEDGELPSPVTPMYVCPGPGWHSEGFYNAYDMKWMQGEPGTRHAEDDSYCGDCIYDAEKDTRMGIRPAVTLGPSLEVELRRCKRVGGH